MKTFTLLLTAGIVILITGCSTTNSIPYKASTNNVIAIQKAFESHEKKVSVGEVAMASGVDTSPTCRLMGPIKVAPGKSLAQYIKDAFIEELFIEKVYSPTAQSTINAKIKNIKFSSVSPASWDAYSARNNVANAFGPAVQALLGKVVTNPQFSALIGMTILF